jgi:L-aspartate oxidase
MSNYVGILRSDLRLKRALSRLKLLFEETEALFDISVLNPQLCELRNVINVAYIIIKMALNRKENRGLHFSIDNPKR